MKKSNHLIAHSLSLLAAAASLACTPSWASTSVQDMGRIEATAAHDATVWTAVARHARHPDLGSASPRRLNGKVDVAFEVAADGSLAQAEVVQSSRSNALDGAALRAIQRARFHPGSQAGRYLVTFDYQY